VKEESQENAKIIRRHDAHGRIRLLRKGITEEKQTSRRCTSSYRSWSLSYKSVR